MRIFFAIAALVLFFAVGATAQTNTLSDAEIQGRKLAQELCDARPAENSTNIGVLKIKNQNGESTGLYLTIKTKVNADDCLVDYDVKTNSNDSSIEWLKTIKSTGHPTIYYSSQHRAGMLESGVFDASLLRGNETVIPFANSDFWLCDLGLEFFHWPAQKVLPKTPKMPTLKLGRDYTLLESTNPNPPTNGYSRVLSWIDKESGGLLQAEAYDTTNQLLKVFEPKSYSKVNGQWQVEEIQIRNVQTGSRTRLVFDLKSH